MKFKKITSLISALAIVMTNSLTAHVVHAANETRFPFPLEDLVDENIKTASTYTVEGAENVVYSFTFDSVGSPDAKVRSQDASDGTRSLRIRGSYTESKNRGLGAEFTLKFGDQTADGKYVISFDLCREKSSDYDYAALNYDGWDGPARLTGTTKWTVEYLGLGQDIGGATGTTPIGTWSRYTATLETIADDPQLNFAVANGGELHIDNIIIKDTSGNVIFAESFESTGPTIGTPEEPGEGDVTRFPFPLENKLNLNITEASTFTVEGAENVVYSFTFDDQGKPDAKLRDTDASDGTRSMRIRGSYTTSTSRGLGALFTLKFGNPTENGNYVISFDLYREKSSNLDYAALNYDGWDGAARLSSCTKWTVTELGAGNSIGGTGTGSWSRYTATLLTYADDPQLNFAVADGGELHIDNIIIKDTSGNVIFAESFEADGPIIAVPEEPGEGDVTRFPFPLENKLNLNITEASTFTVEGAENVVYSFTFDDQGKPDAKLRDTDASDGTRSMRIRGSYTTSTSRGLGALFTLKFGDQTADGKYVISFDLYRESSSDYDYAALNYDGWDGAARLTGTTKWTVEELGAGNSIGGTGTGTWSRYTATLLTYADDPQLNFAVADGGELHIDNIIIKDTSGNVIFAESFEADGPIIAVPEEPDEPEDVGTRFPFPLEDYLDQNIKKESTFAVEGVESVTYIFAFDSTGSPDAKLRKDDASDGTRSVRIRGSYTKSTAKGLGAEFTIKFGDPTADGKYDISFDLYRELSSEYDYAALNYDGWDGAARLTGTTKWTVTQLGAGNSIGGVGTGTWSRYTATLETTADDPQLNFAVANGGELHIDNIIIKDSSGNVIFAESFEADGPIIGGTTIEPSTAVIYDAEFKVVQKVGDQYIVIDDATNLTANTLVMSVVKFENEISGNIYTALYRDNCLINFEMEVISSSKGAVMSSGTVFQIPALNDGVYKLKVFVWDNELNALKDVMFISE